MPYLNPFLRLTLSGTLGASEIFSYGLHLVGNGPVPDEVPAGVITACEDFHDSGIIGSVAHLRTIKLNQIGTNGKYTGDETVLYDFPGEGIIPSPTAKQALQIATVVSLGTEASRGTASKGRFYIPAPTAGPQSPNQTMAVSDALAVLTQAQTFLEALNDSVPGYLVGLVSNIGSGKQSVVTRVRVGQAFDTIRSRRNKIPEAYQELPVEHDPV